MSILGLDDSITFGLYHQFSNPWSEKLLYYSASTFVYLLPVVLIYLFWRGGRDRVNSVKIFFIAVLAWQVLSALVGHYLYSHYGFRDRPFAVHGLQEFFFERPQKAFPSDHAAVIFGVMLALFAYGYRRPAWVFLVVGSLSALARVVVGFHYFGDIIGGFLIGGIAFWIIWLLQQPLDRWLSKIFRLTQEDNLNGQPI